jgi:hypothetical protein
VRSDVQKEAERLAILREMYRFVAEGGKGREAAQHADEDQESRFRSEQTA